MEYPQNIDHLLNSASYWFFMNTGLWLAMTLKHNETIELKVKAEPQIVESKWTHKLYKSYMYRGVFFQVKLRLELLYTT